jgi:mannosyl-glycoprotein endo-beta-N-acetylglucosaminidase
MAHYMPATSPVNDIPFMTNFNTGQGHLYSIEGETRGSFDWNNRSLQDVLPTWRWISISSSTPLYPELCWDQAYYGGTSLKVSGDLVGGVATNLLLYKTDLTLAGSENLVLCYDVNQGTGEESGVGIGLSFSDNPGVFEHIDAGTVTSTGWNEFTASLASFGGRTIDQIRLEFETPTSVGDYEALIGRLGIIDGLPDVPAPPSGLYVESFEQIDDNNGTIRLRWTHSSDEVYSYNVYRLNPDSSLTFLGSSPNNAYFVPLVQRVEPETETTILVEAVSPEFGYSEPVETSITWTITGIEEEGGGPSLLLLQPSPNPVPESGASLGFSLPEAGRARLTLYSVDGRVVTMLADSELGAGWHDVNWVPEGLCPGVYFLRLESRDESRTRKCVLIR